MTENDVEAELSYAYVHAIAAKAGVACQCTTRTADNMGIDASLHIVKDFGEGATLTELSINLQLKATVAKPSLRDGRLSYSLDLASYNKLRQTTIYPRRFLVVLFLPAERNDWLVHSQDHLVVRRCAYWVSLTGADASSNTSSQTIYLPESQLFSPDALLTLLGRVAREEELRYEP